MQIQSLETYILQSQFFLTSGERRKDELGFIELVV